MSKFHSLLSWKAMRNFHQLFFIFLFYNSLYSFRVKKNWNPFISAKLYETVGFYRSSISLLIHWFQKMPKIEILASGFDWSEGRFGWKIRGGWFFRMCQRIKIYRWSEVDSLSIFLEAFRLLLGSERIKRRSQGQKMVLCLWILMAVFFLCQHGQPSGR